MRACQKSAIEAMRRDICARRQYACARERGAASSSPSSSGESGASGCGRRAGVIGVCGGGSSEGRPPPASGLV